MGRFWRGWGESRSQKQRIQVGSRSVCLLASAGLAAWIAACSSDVPSETVEHRGVAGEAGAQDPSGGAAGVAGHGGSALVDGGAGAAVGGASSAGESSAGGSAVAGAADGGAGMALAGASTGGADACAAAPRQLPLGTFSLQLENSVKLCNQDDLSCADVAQGSGVGEGTLTLVEWPGTRDGNVIYINGTLLTPTLDLDGKGAHAEEYQGMLVKVADTWEGGFDLGSMATSVTLWGDNCFNQLEPGGIGKTLVTIMMSDGQVTSLDRHCLTEYDTIYYSVTTTGTGALLCQ